MVSNQGCGVGVESNLWTRGVGVGKIPPAPIPQKTITEYSRISCHAVKSQAESKHPRGNGVSLSQRALPLSEVDSIESSDEQFC